MPNASSTAPALRFSLRPAILVAVLGVLAMRPAPTLALELLANGKFDGSTQGWGGCCNATGDIAYDATRDAVGSSLSGSLELTHVAPPAPGEDPSILFVAQCISGPGVQPGTAYFFGAKLRLREGEISEGDSFLSVEFRPDTACQQTNLGAAGKSVDVAELPRGTWIPVELGSRKDGVVAPAGTQSMRVIVAVRLTVGEILTVNADDIFAAAAGTPLCDGLPATKMGTPIGEILIGTTGSDVIVGRGGPDWIDGKGGNDRLCGGGGADVVYGGLGDDRVFGQGGDDDVYGGANDDFVSGGAGDDDLFGDSGIDTLKGGSGSDDCDGGSGAPDVAFTCESGVAVP